MIRNAINKIRKRPTKTDPQDPPVADLEGGSIQERIDRMRRKSESSLSLSIDSDPTSLQGDSEEEAFVKNFAQELKGKMVRKAQTPAAILRERSREMREGIGPPLPLEPEPQAAPGPEPEPVAEAKPEPDLPAKGALLAIKSGELAIFHKNVPDKGYQLVYMVNADGTVSPQGIYLDAHEFREIGALSAVPMQDLQKSLTWDRDALVFHLKNIQDTQLIPRAAEQPNRYATSLPAATNGAQRPAPTPTRIRAGNLSTAEQIVIRQSLTVASQPEPEAMQPEPPAPEPEALQPEPETSVPDPGLVRGRRFRISMGKDREWDAVYWGTDEQGTVVAHRTHGKWTLMHLDIARFENSLILNGQLDERELREVEKNLREAHA